MIKLLNVLIALFLFIPSVASAKWYDVHLIRVVDGDTVEMGSNSSSKTFMCRLYGIDAPELHFQGMAQPYGQESKDFLETSLKKWESFQIQVKPKDKYGRNVCRIVKVIDNIPFDFNWNQVRQGYAWAYKSYLSRPYASLYIKAEEQAREDKLGLWQDANPTPPWEFRSNKKLHSKSEYIMLITK